MTKRGLPPAGRSKHSLSCLDEGSYPLSWPRGGGYPRPVLTGVPPPPGRTWDRTSDRTRGYPLERTRDQRLGTSDPWGYPHPPVNRQTLVKMYHLLYFVWQAAISIQLCMPIKSIWLFIHNINNGLQALLVASKLQTSQQKNSPVTG